MHYRWKFLLAILTVAICPILAGSAGAQDKDGSESSLALYDAQVIIDGCDHLAADLLAGDVSDVISGHVETAACLKSALLTHLEAMFDPEILTPAYAEWMLVGMAYPTAELYGLLWNAHKECYCGEAARASDVEAIVTLYKGLLRDVVYQRNTYRL